MNWGVKNVDVSGSNCYMNSHTLSEANSHNYIDYTKKRDLNAPNLSTMKNTGLHDGFDFDVIFPASKINQYSNME